MPKIGFRQSSHTSWIDVIGSDFDHEIAIRRAKIRMSYLPITRRGQGSLCRFLELRSGLVQAFKTIKVGPKLMSIPRLSTQGEDLPVFT